MKVFNTISETREALADCLEVALVPTMGALHEGHLSLVKKARELVGNNGTVIVSIFVNPTQFGEGEDFDNYPNPLDRDLELCKQERVDAVFVPASDKIYYDDRSLFVEERSLSGGLCGASREGHFDGVCLVVLKLFNIVQPDYAVFGKKDYQQLAIIRRMVRDLNVNVKIAGGETVREEDGLAMSSRNAYLDDEERKQAPQIRRALLELKELFESGETRVEALKNSFKLSIKNNCPLGVIDYVEIVNQEDLKEAKVVREDSLIACAVQLGKARLIDNIELNSKEK